MAPGRSFDGSNEGFDALNQRADSLYDAGLFADALQVYQAALNSPDSSTDQSLWTRYWIGVCLRLLGRYGEALSYIGEVYVEARQRRDLDELACRSLIEQLESLNLLQESSGLNTPENLRKQLAIVEEGVQWLRDIGRHERRAPFEYARARILEDLGQLTDALDVAEQAYCLAKESDFTALDIYEYPYMVLRLARRTGEYKRGLNIFEEVKNFAQRTTKVALLVEYSYLLLDREDLDCTASALDSARLALRLAEQLQSHETRLLAYAALARIAVSADSFEEARDALRRLRDLAFSNQTDQRGMFLRAACKAFRDLEDDFPEFLPRWAEEMDKELRSFLETGSRAASGG